MIARKRNEFDSNKGGINSVRERKLQLLFFTTVFASVNIILCYSRSFQCSPSDRSPSRWAPASDRFWLVSCYFFHGPNILLQEIINTEWD